MQWKFSGDIIAFNCTIKIFVCFEHSNRRLFIEDGIIAACIRGLMRGWVGEWM